MSGGTQCHKQLCDNNTRGTGCKGVSCSLMGAIFSGKADKALPEVGMLELGLGAMSGQPCKRSYGWQDEGHMHKDKRSEGVCQTEEAMVMWFDWGRRCIQDKVGAVVSDTVRL